MNRGKQGARSPPSRRLLGRALSCLIVERRWDRVRWAIEEHAWRSGVLAKRYGVSIETIRKWRKRGPADCQDRSARPHKLPGTSQ